MRIVFMGTPPAAVPSLARLLNDGHDVVAVYTQPDRPSGRGNRLTPPPVKTFAADAGLPVLQPLKIRTEDAIAEFRSHGADVAVVVAFGRILPKSFLGAFRYGAINVHFSLLPKYRGAAPVNWAIANGESVSGVTTMQMDEGLDTGDILLQKEVAIGDDENAAELMTRLSNVGAELLSETLDRIEEISPRHQDESDATHAPLMKREDGRIDWSRPATEIANRVRAFQPFPTSFTFFEGKKLTIWKAVATDESSAAAPGEVVEASRDLVVACGGGTVLHVDELQLEGKRRMSVHDFLNGVRLSAGDRFS